MVGETQDHPARTQQRLMIKVTVLFAPIYIWGVKVKRKGTLFICKDFVELKRLGQRCGRPHYLPPSKLKDRSWNHVFSVLVLLLVAALIVVHL